MFYIYTNIDAGKEKKSAKMKIRLIFFYVSLTFA